MDMHKKQIFKMEEKPFRSKGPAKNFILHTSYFIFNYYTVMLMKAYTNISQTDCLQTKVL
jgi:hypothetical protein